MDSGGLTVEDALLIAAALHAGGAVSVTLASGMTLPIVPTSLQQIAHCDVPGDGVRGLVRVIAQSLTKTSKSAQRARYGSHITWIMAADAETGEFTRGAGWGRIEDGVLATNSTAALDQASVLAYRKARGPKPKAKKPAAGSAAAIAAAAAKKQRAEKKANKRKREEDAPPLPAVAADFALSATDALSIARALHCDAQPDCVTILSAGMGDEPRTLEIKRGRNSVRRCDVIVDEARPGGYCKLMTQNKTKASASARRAIEEGAHITWILPLDAAGKHTHNSTWGRIVDGVLEKAPRPALA